MTDVVLFGIPQSRCVRAVRMLCIEKAIDYAIAWQMPHSDLIEKMHPFGRIPVLKHKDFYLCETSAILRYLDEAFAPQKFIPTDPRDRARMEQWISVINCYLDSAMMQRLVVQYAFPTGSGGVPDRSVIEQAVPVIKRQLALLDVAFAEGPYLLGKNICLADLLLAPIMAYVAQTPEGRSMIADAANIPRSLATIASRRSFIETIPPPPPARLPTD